MAFTSSRRKYDRKVTYFFKKRRCTTVILHVNSSESKNLNTLNSDNVIGTSNFPHINVQNEIPFNTLINLQKVTDAESILSINDEILDEKI